MDYREKEYLELLNKKFDESNFIDFTRDLLNISPFDIFKNIGERKDIPQQYQENIEYYKYIAKYNDGINNIGILIVKLGNKTSTNARTAQRNFIATILSKYDLDASLVAFYSDRESNWRLSFVKKEIDFTDKGFKIELTPAKRFSYLVGENESVHTAKEYLLKLLRINDRKIKIDDIEQVFDVEKVTKKFFEEYKEKYLQLKDFLDNNEDFKVESKKFDFSSVEFAKKLMGQIVFLYFLQKKGWLGVQLVPNKISVSDFNELLSKNDIVSQNVLKKFYILKDDFYVIEKTKLRLSELEEDIVNLSNIFKNTNYDNPWGTGQKDFIRFIYKQAMKEHKNFFDDYLEPFFYKGLNEQRDNQYFALFNCKIPFLNGGLFEPINNYRWSSANFSIPNSLFSNENKDGILDFLDLYNFTIDEEEPLEKDIAVDPEMLGKIFENLLDINDRKSKGAFYTPRDIVYYMCQESLANYLVTKVHINYDEIIEFIKYGDLISQMDYESLLTNSDSHKLGNTIYNNIIAIDKALMNVKIADPAVGSGAFPLGMLTEIVKLRNNLTAYMNVQKELGTLQIDFVVDSEQMKRDLFDMKLQTIENCIYAVDIEPSAVDITKLRLWLSLIVDYPNEEEPRPLPNLDCKIMQGNSLLDEFEGVPLFSAKILANNLKNYKRKASNINMVSDIYIQQSWVVENRYLDNDYMDLNMHIEEMIELQKEYFNTSNSKLKKELKEKIELIQLGMVEESLRSQPEKLKKFDEMAKKKNKPWFIWKLEFYDVFKNNGGFDIVIGNPPYVDSESMSKNDPELRKVYSQKYKVAKGNWDLFVIFFELGFSLLSSDGILAFIVPNKLISANYSKTLRDFLCQKTVVEIRDYSNVKVFKEAKVYPVTIVSQQLKQNNDVVMTVMNDINNIGWQNRINNKSFHNAANWDTYFSYDVEYGNIISKILNKSRELDTFDVEIKGAATVNDAYVTKEVLHESLNLTNELKFINTGTIDPFRILWGVKPTQYIKGKYNFPVVDRDKFKKVLNSRYDDAINEKIVIAGMTKTLECVYAPSGVIAGKSTIVIFSKTINLNYILGLLNSRLMTFFYRIYYNSSSLEGGFYSINTKQVRKLPFILSNEYYNDVISLVEKLNNNYNDKDMSSLNLIVYKIYQLSDAQITLIDEYFKHNGF